MVQYHVVRHFSRPKQKSLPIFRPLIQPRVLAMVVPIVGCILFSGIYGVQHSHAVARTQAIASSVKSAKVANANSVQDPASASHASDTTANSSLAPNSHSVTSGPTDSAADGTDIKQQTSPVNNTFNTITGNLTTGCSQIAKTLATTTDQTAVTAENARHDAQVTLLDAQNLTSMLLTGHPSAAMTSENNLHTSNLQKIDATYQDSLNIAHC